VAAAGLYGTTEEFTRLALAVEDLPRFLETVLQESVRKPRSPGREISPPPRPCLGRETPAHVAL